MKRSIGTAAAAVFVGISTMFSGTVVKTEAASLSSLKGQQNKLQSQSSTVNANLGSAKSKLDAVQGQQTNVKNDMKRLDLTISDTNDKIAEKTAQVTEKKSQINKLQGDIKVLQGRIQKRNELLKERARNFQDTGGMVNYLDVLMGSTSFSDFIDRANAVATIMEADQEIIKEHEVDEKNLQGKQTKVEKDLSSLQGMVNDLQTMNQQLNSQRQEKNKLLASLQQQEKGLSEDMLDLEEQQQILAAQAAAVKKAIQLEQERLAEAAKSSGSGAPPAVSGGTWTRPAQGIITSGFGTRPDFRPGEFHYGVDIANSGSNVPIVAAADGVVVRARYSNSYGNYAVITHSINGQIYTTVYAHMRKLLISSGDVVRKGQQIGIMGSTGDSTGQHLHFELHKGEWVRNTVGAVDPRSVIPF